MFRRYLSSRTIGVLKSSALWRNLCLNAELQPEIRDDAITVYYRGGGLLRNLRVVGDSITAELHPKFVPLAVPPSTTSMQLVSEADGGLRFADTTLPRPIGLADADVLAAYKEAMDQVLVSFPEGRIIQSTCQRPENQIVDQEIAFQESGEARDKIDLCHFDAALGKLVFVEVKRKSDPRLFKPETEPEVLKQLRAYRTRLQSQRDVILSAYRQVVGWKRELGLGDRLTGIPEGGPEELLQMPVLVIGNCSRRDVEAIKSGTGKWRVLLEGLEEVAAGLILCGRSGCRLDLIAARQTIVF